MMSNDDRLVAERRKQLPKEVESLRDEILGASKFLLENPELGSQEIKAHEYFTSKLNSQGFDVTREYLGMKTAFMARTGKGAPRISLWAEYDALPNGHSCGHNIASAFAYGLALALAKSKGYGGEVFLFGTPSEEDIGPYASSKAHMAPRLKEMRIDAAFFAHPLGEWQIGQPTLAKSQMSFAFLGKEAPYGRPELGLNALDAAVQFYLGYKMLRSSLPRKKNMMTNAVLRDGGHTPKLLIPGRAEVVLEVKTEELAYLEQICKSADDLARGVGASLGCAVKSSRTMPVVEPMKRHDIERFYYKFALEYLHKVVPPQEAWARPVEGAAADIGNVSQVVPTAYLGIKIGRPDLPVHSDEWAERAASSEAQEALMTAVGIGYEAIVEYARAYQTGQVS